jgi:hypothetical protein
MKTESDSNNPATHEREEYSGFIPLTYFGTETIFQLIWRVGSELQWQNARPRSLSRDPY